MSQYTAYASGTHQSSRTESNRATSYQHHLALLSLLLKGEHDAAAHCLQHGAVRPDEFGRFLTQHRLQLFVFSTLEGSPVRELLPREWLDELKKFSLHQWSRQETLVRELAKLSPLLTAAGYEFILLKGPYLAARFFGGIDRREYWDVDVLIRREDLIAVERLLFNDGYVRKSGILLSEAITSRFTHALDFAKPNIAVDLHWLLSANAGHHLNYEAIWSERQTFVLRNHRYFVLSDEYQLVLTLISIFKDLERGAAGLKPFVDLYFILSAVSRDLDWDGFLKRRRRENILRISVNILDLFMGLFDCHDRFPEVSDAVARQQQLVVAVSSEHLHMLIEAQPGALRNKIWAAGIYDCSRIHVFFWWLLSLPFRLAVHNSSKRGDHTAKPVRRRIGHSSKQPVDPAQTSDTHRTMG